MITSQNVLNLFAAVAAFALAPCAAVAATYPAGGWFLRADDGGGTSSLNGSGSTPGGWTNATGAVSLGMAANGDYFILNDKETYLIRTPDKAASYAVPSGASLTLTPGARLSLAFKGSPLASRPDVTIPDIRVMEGARLTLLPSHAFSEGSSIIAGTDVLKGNISLASGSELLINTYAQGTDIRRNELAASVTGKGTISWVPSASTVTSTRHDAYVTGDMSGFSGSLVHYSPELVTGYNILSFENENSVPANPAPGESAHVAISNGVSFIVQRAFWDSAANRSWDFGSGRTPYIAAGTPQARIIIRGRATGSSGFYKNGYGTLVFAGETDISGTATVSYGVVYVEEPALALTNSVTWSVTAGDATVHYPDSVEMPTLYLKGTDSGGQSSMSGTSNCGGWATTPGGAASKTAAVMKKRYVIDGGCLIRSPAEVNKHYVFAGNTLTVRNGAVVNVLSAYGSDFAERTLTVADLRVPADGICKMQGASGINKAYGWGGNYMIGAGGELAFYGAPTATNRIYAAISGPGRLAFRVNTGLNPPGKQEDFILGDLSAFTGVIETYGPGTSARPTLGFSTARSFPGDCAAATADGLVVTNGARLAFAASGEIGPNRGVLFGSGARPVVDVAADETATVNSAVTGTSGFEKTGAGTLVFTGSLRRLSGEVKVTAGTLVLPHKSRCGAFTLDVASGASVVYSNAGVGLVYYLR